MKTRFFVSTIGVMALVLAGTIAAIATTGTLHPRPGPQRRDRGSSAIVFSAAIGGGRIATIYRDARVSIVSKDGGSHFEQLAPSLRPLLATASSPLARRQILDRLQEPHYGLYAPGFVNVVFADTVPVSHDKYEAAFAATGSPASAVPSYTGNAQVNRVLASLKADKMQRLFPGFSRGQLRAMASRVGPHGMRPALDIANAYRFHIAGASVFAAAARLRRERGVLYAQPEWMVSTMNTGPVVLPQKFVALAREQAAHLSMRRPHAQLLSADDLPSNYGVASAEQSFLDAPGVDARAAYDIIRKKFGQLPGQGEIVTNVTLGDECALGYSTPLSNEPPNSYLIGSQHYLAGPSLPLIPEYSVDANGVLSGAREVCGLFGGTLDEPLLDFSVMAPLPHQLQVRGAAGIGLTDLLGIAPGAAYRMVVPSVAATDDALMLTYLRASTQMPKPDVMTSSLGMGTDTTGFPTRYLEEDPLIESTIATVVNSGIVVCISAGDGLRLYTNAPVAPSGGAALMNATSDVTQMSDTADIAFSTAPSVVLDSGSIAVGGTTTDDIFSAPPNQRAAFANILTYPETRWNGSQNFASPYGPRVNVSAPSDNISTLSLVASGSPPAYEYYPSLAGGTSASAPETAAAAAVMLQVARLTGHPFADPAAVRKFLEKTGTPVTNAPQADRKLTVGPQIDVRRGVEQLLANAGKTVAPAVPAVAIAERQGVDSSCFEPSTVMPGADATFTEATDPAQIVLNSYPNNDFAACTSYPIPPAMNLTAYITLAPDWEGIPANARYRLYVTGHPSDVLATTPWARMLPQRLLRAAGIALPTSQTESISLTYEADRGFHTEAAATFTLTFQPTPTAMSLRVLAPKVPSVVTGSTIPVNYDFSGYPPSLLASPVIVVSYPGRSNSTTGLFMYPLYTSPVLTASKGTIQVPVSALQGGGIYGVAVQLNPQPASISDPNGASASDSDFAMVDVEGPSTARPAAPLLDLPSPPLGFLPTHDLTVPYLGSFTVSYDVSNVPGATGGTLEISSPGSTYYGSSNPFNNPDGTVLDANGHDTGSAFNMPVSGTTGTLTLTAAQAHLVPGLQQTIRIIPTAGSGVVGEAGEVSTIAYTGITAADGGSVAFGFAINPAGDDALYTSAGMDLGLSGGLEAASTVGSFSQSTGASKELTGYVGGEPPPFSLVGGGFVSPLTYQFLRSPGNTNPGGSSQLQYYQLLEGGSATTWYPNFPSSVAILESASRLSDGSLVLVVTDRTGTKPSVTTVNVTAKTQTALVPLSPPGMLPPATYITMDVDSSTNTAYVIMANCTSVLCANGTMGAADYLAVVNLTAGTVTYKALGNLGAVKDIEVDPTTHKAFFAAYFKSTSNFYVFDLPTVTITSTTPVPITTGSAGIVKLSLDSANGLVFAQLYAPPSQATDNNPLSQVVELNESGTVLSTSPSLYNFNCSQGLPMNHFFESNGTTRLAFTLGGYNTANTVLNCNQIVPFSY